MNLVGPLLITFFFFTMLFAVGMLLQRSERGRRKMLRAYVDKTTGMITEESIRLVDLDAPSDVRYWAGVFAISEEELRETVRQHGSSIAVIRAALAKRKRQAP